MMTDDAARTTVGTFVNPDGSVSVNGIRVVPEAEWCAACSGRGYNLCACFCQECYRVCACRACHAHGRVRCHACQGRRLRCETCAATGEVTKTFLGFTRQARCPNCGGRGQRACATCKGETLLTCPACGGSPPAQPPACARCNGRVRIFCDACLATGNAWFASLRTHSESELRARLDQRRHDIARLGEQFAWYDRDRTENPYKYIVVGRRQPEEPSEMTTLRHQIEVLSRESGLIEQALGARAARENGA